MTIKSQKDFDSKFNDISLISTRDEDDRSPSTYKQRQQTRILYIVKFLSSMSYNISIALSAYILKQYLGKIDAEDGNSLEDLSFYPIFASTCASIAWGLISDRVGRKTALNISLIGSALIMALFGFSKSFNSLAFINALLNIFDCSHIFIHMMVGESNCKISRPKAFSYLPIIDFVAGIFGPMITTPFLVPLIYDIVIEKDTTSITGFPYLIPSLVASVISVAAYILSYYCLSETLTDKRSKSNGPAIADISTNQNMILEKSRQISIFGLSLSKNSLLLLILSSLLSLIYETYSKISREWLTMDTSKGGLNLKLDHIMIVIPLSPIIMFTILLKYPYIYKNLGVLKQFISGFPAAGVLFILSIILATIAKSASTFTVLSLYAIIYSIECGVDTLKGISFDLLLIESAEVSGNLGTLYGISGTLSGIIYFIVNYICKSLSSFSTKNNLPFPLNCNLIWILATSTLIGYWLSLKIEITDQQNQETSREHKL